MILVYFSNAFKIYFCLPGDNILILQKQFHGYENSIGIGMIYVYEYTAGLDLASCL